MLVQHIVTVMMPTNHTHPARHHADIGTANDGHVGRLSDERHLRARPMFHHTRDAIEAHLTIVFAALAIARHLQEATGLSIRKIVHTPRPLQQISVRIAGHDHIARDPLTPPAEQILHALGINPD